MRGSGSAETAELEGWQRTGRPFRKVQPPSLDYEGRVVQASSSQSRQYLLTFQLQPDAMRLQTQHGTPIWNQQREKICAVLQSAPGGAAICGLE